MAQGSADCAALLLRQGHYATSIHGYNKNIAERDRKSPSQYYKLSHTPTDQAKTEEKLSSIKTDIRFYSRFGLFHFFFLCGTDRGLYGFDQNGGRLFF